MQHQPIPPTALCYSAERWRVWLWSDAISGVAAFEQRDNEEWRRCYAGDVPQSVIVAAREFFGGGRYYWIGASCAPVVDAEARRGA